MFLARLLGYPGSLEQITTAQCRSTVSRPGLPSRWDGRRWPQVSNSRLASDFLFCHTINYLKNPLLVSCLPPAPEVVNGRTHRATVVDLSPWVEYEFRVVASNSVGIGEPSSPSALLRTKAAGKALLPDSLSQLSTLGMSLQQSHSFLQGCWLSCTGRESMCSTWTRHWVGVTVCGS